ncbi:MAG: ATPase, partial [Alphaproteobacteria bacterium]
VFLNLPLVLLPAHIAFLHLIIEPASSIAFEVEPESESIMNRPPRDPQEPLFNKNLWLPSILKGASVLIALLGIFIISLGRGQSEEDARALVFTTLIISNIMLIYLRGNRQSGKPNNVVNWITISSIIMMAIILYVPSLRKLFHFSYLHPVDIVICLVVAVFSLVWMKLPFLSNLQNQS